MIVALHNPELPIVLVVAVRDDSAFGSVGPNRQVTPNFDGPNRRSKTGAAIGCGLGRGGQYAA